MHWQAYSFVTSVKSAFPEHFTNSCVAEFGSSTVNYSIKNTFENPSRYFGIDLAPGKNVDIVANAKDVFVGTDFDVTISCECFEHNPYYLETFNNMCQHTKAGGLVIFTCATTGRPEHGTSRTSPEESPGSQQIGWDYYNNLTKNDFEKVEMDEIFQHYSFHINNSSNDLYFVGIKKGILEDFQENFEFIEECHRTLLSLSTNLNKAWTTGINATNVLNDLQILRELDFSIFSQEILRSYIVKIIENLDGNNIKLEFLLGLLLSSACFKSQESDIYRQIYLVNKALKNTKEAFNAARFFFQNSPDHISLFFLTESIYFLNDKRMLQKTILGNLKFINSTVDITIRIQILGYLISTISEKTENLGLDIVERFIDRDESNLLYLAFTGKILVKLGRRKDAASFLSKIDKNAIPERYSWIANDIDNLVFSNTGE